MNKNQFFDQFLSEIRPFKTTYFLTLNTFINDQIIFERHLEKLFNQLNKYCFGRSFKRNNKRLKILGAKQIGIFNETLHCHLVIAHNNDMKRSHQEIEYFIRKNWLGILKTKSKISSNLIKFEEINNLSDVMFYSLRELKFNKTQNYLAF